MLIDYALDADVREACEEGDVDALGGILAKGVSPETGISYEKKVVCKMLHLIVLEDHLAALAAVEFLLAKGADINTRDSEGRTPLHWALNQEMCSIEMVKLLLDKGADVRARDVCGLEPLHVAAGWGHAEAAKLLLERGADVNAKAHNALTPPEDGLTPLDVAEESGQLKGEHLEEITKVLIEHGGKDGWDDLDEMLDDLDWDSDPVLGL